MTGDDGESAFGVVQRGVGAVGDIESQVGLPVGGVGAVAFEAFVGEDGPDVEVVADPGAVAGAVVVQAGSKNKDGSRDQDRYGGDATDGSRFSLKIR